MAATKETREFSEFIKTERDKVIKRSAFCRKYKLSRSTLKNWENNGVLPPVFHLVNLSSETGIALSELIAKHDDAARKSGKATLDVPHGIREPTPGYHFGETSGATDTGAEKDAGLNIFISYCHDDILARHDLEKYLMTLEQHGLVSSWQEAKISSRREWQSSIIKALDKSDVLIMLLSRRYMAASDGAKAKAPPEIKNLTSSHCKIMPIIVGHCQFQDWQFWPEHVQKELINRKETEQSLRSGNFEFFPLNQQGNIQAINLWQIPEEAWIQVTRRLRELSEATHGVEQTFE